MHQTTTTTAAAAATFSFPLTSQVFAGSLYVRPGSMEFPKSEPLGIAFARFLRAGCPSCHPINSAEALKGCSGNPFQCYEDHSVT